MRILIAEDEYYARKALCDSIHAWRQDAQLVEAENGIAALAQLEAQGIDILLTDIRMPGMDGLALAERVREQYPDVYVVIVTGYDAFEYARRAIVYGVREYLLKPVADDALLEALSRAQDALDAQQESRRQQESLAETGRRLMAELLSQATVSWLNGRQVFPPPELPKAADAVVISVWGEGDRQQGALPEVGERVAAGLAALPGMRQYVPLPGSTSLSWAQWGLVLLDGEAGQEALREALRGLPATLGAGVRMAVSARVPVGEAPQAFQQAQIAALYRLLRPDRLLRYDSLTEAAVYVQGLSPTENTALAVHLTQGNEAEAIAIADGALCRIAGTPNASIVSLQDMLGRLNARLNGILSQKLGDAPGRDGLFLYVIPLEDMTTFAMLREEVARNVRSVCHAGRQAATTNADEAVAYMQQYVREHFSQNIALKDLAAEHLYMNPSYLSRLFKTRMGISFKRYLTDTRMEWARGMLERSDMSIFRISQGCGYSDASQFIQQFRKQYGATPGVWRSQHAQAFPKEEDHHDEL